jgi:XTP/dITP diphosphohydrolase
VANGWLRNIWAGKGRQVADARPVLLGTSNEHKLAELRAILGDLPLTLLSLGDVAPVSDVEETGATFAENAVLKATAYAHASGLLTLADDSGLEIDALGGEPGVYSARWAGVNTPYSERFRIILERMAQSPPERRTARYRCVIAIAEPDRLLATAEGVLEGMIATEPQGSGGFGYDPIFSLPAYGKTVAELPAEVKNRISHRALAAAQARQQLLDIVRNDESSPPSL